MRKRKPGSQLIGGVVLFVTHSLGFLVWITSGREKGRKTWLHHKHIWCMLEDDDVFLPDLDQIDRMQWADHDVAFAESGQLDAYRNNKHRVALRLHARDDDDY